MSGPRLKDAQWVRQAFLVKQAQLELVDQQNRFWSSANLKFTDTTPGGNFAINPPPQFTSYADLRAESRYAGHVTDNQGMGRYYSEAIDDHSQVINLRFGVPQFNSMSQFFTGFYNTKAGQLARTGRAEGFFYELGRAATFMVSIMSWQLLAVGIIGAGFRFAMKKPHSKYYYLKPTMPLYWNAVTTMVNQLAVNRGIVPRIGGADQQAINGGYEFDAAAQEKLHQLLPDIFREGGDIDVYAMANRAQRLARKRYKAMEEATNGDFLGDLSKAVQDVVNEKLSDTRPNFKDYLSRWFSAAPSKPADTSNPGAGTEELKNDESSNSGFLDFLTAELDDGSAFASFRVNATGQVNESFTNSVTESELSQKINSMSSQSRSTRFSFADGNFFGGALGAALGGITGAVKDFAAGVTDQLEISGLAAIGGAAFVDIPKHWQSSAAQLPRANYTIQLVSPYGNPMSQLLNIYVPLCMLLAGALPLSTGKQSYTSPFLCELYDQGRCQTRLGMIDSLSVTRGVGNLGFNNEGHAMGVEVTFSIIDMSSILHMPIVEGFSLNATVAGAEIGAVAGTVAGGPVGTVAGAAVGGAAGHAVDTVQNIAKSINGVFDDDTAFSDYMAVLAGMGVADQIYAWRKFKLNLTRQMVNWRSFYSKSHFASVAGNVAPVRLADIFFKGTSR